jgi:hypothetical protein
MNVTAVKAEVQPPLKDHREHFGTEIGFIFAICIGIGLHLFVESLQAYLTECIHSLVLESHPSNKSVD